MSRAFAIGEVVHLRSAPGALMTVESLPEGSREFTYCCVWFGTSGDVKRGTFVESSLVARTAKPADVSEAP